MAHAVTCVVVGAGERGTVYSQYAAIYPDRLRVEAVCEPRKVHRDRLVERHDVPKAFDDWRALVSMPKLADFAIISTQDQQHCEPAVALAKMGCESSLISPETRPGVCAWFHWFVRLDV